MRQQGLKFEEIHGAYATGKRMVTKKTGAAQLGMLEVSQALLSRFFWGKRFVQQWAPS